MGPFLEGVATIFCFVGVICLILHVSSTFGIENELQKIRQILEKKKEVNKK